MQVYYPPLFHLIALGLFMAFSKVDPYTIMKILASAFSALEIVPVYLIVKRISGSSAGGLLASFSLLAALNDYEMLAWGGYANIAGLFFAACVVFAVITDSAVLSAISGTALALTHHLSTVLIVAVLVPYFLIAIWRRRSIPRSLIGLAGAAAIAYLVFYQFALASLFDYYVRLHYYYPVYDQSLYVTPYILEQVGPPLLVAGAAGIALAFAHNRKFLERFEILPIWGAIPTLLAYAYLLGVQWHGVRWIAFIPEPLCVLTGIGLGYFDKRKIVFIILGLLFAIQLLWSLQSYHFDILTNLVQ
jgi:hypothetical protein